MPVKVQIPTALEQYVGRCDSVEVPGETVGEAVANLAEQYPELRQRFVFLTGDTVSRETMAFFEQTGVRWLTKPFRAAEVRRTIQQVLPAR